MTKREIMKMFRDTEYIRVGGSAEELKCAEYIKDKCASFGCEAHIEPFKSEFGDVHSAALTIDGKEIPCTGYAMCGSGSVTAPFVYLPVLDRATLSDIKGKIVMTDNGMGYWNYQDICDNGAVGFITYSGDVHYADHDIDKKELRSYVSKGRKILGVTINAKDAVKLMKGDPKEATITVDQTEYEGESRNVVLDLPGTGESDRTIIFTAHYDSVILSKGAYDNMSGSVGIMAMAEHFAKTPHRNNLRFVWCGSEERGLFGSKAYCEAHEDELEKIDLCINLDMIGSTMGKFIACCTTEEKLVGYIEYLGLESGFGIKVRQDVYSSDSTPFADKGVPAVSFARLAGHSTATIHNRYDTIDIIKPENMVKDIEFIQKFADRMANAVVCPVDRKIPDNMKEKLDIYQCRKRDPKR
ncbi:MAG: M28 family metallopeptidase [Oscillospiraceae bacterium]|nr:M28 family metallopeptidase [Oscillospiraceae bacterium]